VGRRKELGEEIRFELVAVVIYFDIGCKEGVLGRARQRCVHV
jgi:hypothetical protein